MPTVDNMTAPSVPEIFDSLAAGMADVIAGLTPAQWESASPCAGWTARDVLAHLIDTQRDFFIRHGFGLPERPDVSDPVAAWAAHTAAVGALLADPQVPGRTVDGFFGPTTIGDTLLQFYGFDLIAHRWDLAAVTATPYRFTEDELEALERSIAAFGDAIRMEGVCGPAVDPGVGADRQTRVLAELGRTG